MARGPWLAVVLIALMHVVGCSHGPLAGGPWQVDARPAATAASPTVSREVTGQTVTRPAPCAGQQDRRYAEHRDGHHHGPQQCTGVDEPALGQADGAKWPFAQVTTETSGGVPRAVPVRGPPAPEPGHRGNTQRAVLQVWRN